MKIYIAGKITGLPDAEYTALFAAASAHAKHLGHTPLNPVELCAHLPAGSTWEQYMAICIKAIHNEAEAIWLLSNWTDSRGAQLEVEIGKLKGIPVLSLSGIPSL